VGGTTLTVTDGTGTGAILLPILDNTTFGGTGHIVGIVILNPGDNYSTPNVTAAGGAGSGFSANLVLGATNQNPTSCAYFQQRLMLASTPNNPVTIYGSRSGYYNNFDKSNPILDSDSIAFTLAAKQVNSINHMLAMPGGLILFTDSEVLQLSGGSSSAINPLAVTPATATSVPIIPFGAQVGTRPIKVVSNILYVQSEGTIIREIIYNVFFGNLYSGNDLTVLSSHLFYPNTVVDWAYQDVPFKVVWMVRSDGQLLSMTYLKEQEVVGISRHDTNGLFESVAVIREGTTQAVYFVVNRNGTRCVERLCDRVYNQLSDIWALDCGLSYSGAPATVISGFPSFMNGTTVFALADGVSRGPFTVTGGTITLPVAASNVVAGYEYFPQLQTLYLDTNAGEGTIQGKRKNLVALTARVDKTRGLEMGPTFDDLTSYKDRDLNTIGQPIELFTGDQRMVIGGGWQTEGQLCIQQANPLPATILGVIPEIQVGDTGK